MVRNQEFQRAFKSNSGNSVKPTKKYGNETQHSYNVHEDDIENAFIAARGEMKAPPPASELMRIKTRPWTAYTNHEGGENNQIEAINPRKDSGNRMVYLNDDVRNKTQQFISNYIRTTKYTAASFIPMGLIN